MLRVCVCIKIIVKPWSFLGDIGAAIQEYAGSNGYSVARDFGGHGVGLDIHEDNV
ncbi:MAG: methionyl aminopeptidase [Clostridium sp.]